MTTYAEAIAAARTILNDTEATYSYSDADLTIYANDGLAAMVILRPDLFETITTLTCVAGAVQQAPATCVRFMEVFHVASGNVVTEVPRETLDRFAPGWMTQANGTPVNWARHPRSNRTFFVHPPATANLVLNVQYAAVPTRVATANIGSTALPISDAYFPALVEYIVGRAEMRNDEHANDQRASQMMERMERALGTGMQVKPAADREDAAIDGSSKVARNG
jgi:hypothetical protein